MPYQFVKNKPRLGFLIAAILCIGIGLVVTQVQANMHDQADFLLNNPHYLPDEFNPKLKRIDEKFDEVKLGIKNVLRQTEDVLESGSETIHSAAFSGKIDRSKPIYDYTTGTSN